MSNLAPFGESVMLITGGAGGGGGGGSLGGAGGFVMTIAVLVPSKNRSASIKVVSEFCIWLVRLIGLRSRVLLRY
jgi:hypothetical protein